MANTPYPFTSDESSPWDKLVLGGFILPGTVTSFTPTISYIYNAPQNKDKTYADVKFQGMSPRTIDVSILIYSEEDYNTFVNGFVKDVNSQKVKSFGIAYPQAQIWNISQVFITDITPGHPDSANGWVINMKLLEDRKPVQTEATIVAKAKKDNRPGTKFALPARPGNVVG
jgi:hypothetical protein